MVYDYYAEELIFFNVSIKYSHWNQSNISPQQLL